MHLCWYCDHGIELHEPITLPTEYHEVSGQFDVEGQFCSWACAKSYIRDYRVHKAKEYSLLRLAYALSGNPADEPIGSLFPKSYRKEYGGTMDWDAWRRPTTAPVLTLPPHMIRADESRGAQPVRSTPGSSGFSLGPMKLPEPKPSAPKPPPKRMDVLSMMAQR